MTSGVCLFWIEDRRTFCTVTTVSRAMEPTSLSTLFPGYTEVESFVSDDEYESSEEVCYITLDLGDIEPQLVPTSNTYRLVVSHVFGF